VCLCRGVVPLFVGSLETTLSLLTNGQVAVAVAIARANMSLGGGASKTLLAKASDDIDNLVRDPRWDPFKVKLGPIMILLLLIT
jgi:hypothetical protein